VIFLVKYVQLICMSDINSLTWYVTMKHGVLSDRRNWKLLGQERQEEKYHLNSCAHTTKRIQKLKLISWNFHLTLVVSVLLYTYFSFFQSTIFHDVQDPFLLGQCCHPDGCNYTKWSFRQQSDLLWSRKECEFESYKYF